MENSRGTRAEVVTGPDGQVSWSLRCLTCQQILESELTRDALSDVNHLVVRHRCPGPHLRLVGGTAVPADISGDARA